MTAEARHRVANTLHRYVEAADRQDVAAVVALLGGARIRFPHATSSTPEQARDLFTALWAGVPAHRHDVSTLVVEPDDDGRGWTSRAHYTRWLLQPQPLLHTLGQYELALAANWTPTALTVTRTWTLPATGTRTEGEER